MTAVSPVIVSRTAGHRPVRKLADARSTASIPTTRPSATGRPSSGDFFTADDVRSIRKVVVLGNTVAQNLFPGQDPVGSEIQIRNSVYKVVGVLAPKGQTASGSDSDDVVLDAVHHRLGHALRPRRSSRRSWPAPRTSRTSPPRRKRSARCSASRTKSSDGNDDFTVKNQADLASAAESSTQVMTLLLAAIASISLLVGGIGIMNIMLVSVTERTREIGIRMAIGARGSDVLTQFLVESIVMGILGGVVGLAARLAGAKILGHFTGWETVISPIIMIIAVGFSGAVGVFFGYYPARKAAALNPIQALRYE